MGVIAGAQFCKRVPPAGDAGLATPKARDRAESDVGHGPLRMRSGRHQQKPRHSGGGHGHR